ncbi:MAG: nucleoside 2-deoxyribosyltransferase [Pseudomonadota bacterium]
MRPRVYLAGPDVFLPEAAAIGREKARLCEARGLEALYPLDGIEDPGDPVAIFRACVAMLHRADAALINLSPFRGPHADPGTAFEMGSLHALGRPMVAYSADPRDLAARVPTPEGTAGDGVLRDHHGHLVEDFGLADNVMLAIAADDVVTACAIDTEGWAVAAMQPFGKAVDRLIEILDAGRA